MSSHLLTKNSSSRSINLNKSFVLSIIIHLALIFGITFTTFYELPFLKNTPIINVKLMPPSMMPHAAAASNSVTSRPPSNSRLRRRSAACWCWPQAVRHELTNRVAGAGLARLGTEGQPRPRCSRRRKLQCDAKFRKSRPIPLACCMHHPATS